MTERSVDSDSLSVKLADILKMLKSHFDERTEHSDKEIDHFNRACWNIETYFSLIGKTVEFRNYAGIEKKGELERPYKRPRTDFVAPSRFQ